MLGLPGHNPAARLPTRAWAPLILTTSTTTSTPHIRRLLAGEAGFPAALAAIPSPAKVLWYRGRLPDPEQPALAVVGSRAATVAGCRRARDFAAAAAGHG